MLAVTAHFAGEFDAAGKLPPATGEGAGTDMRAFTGLSPTLCLSGPFGQSLAPLWHAELEHVFLRWVCDRGSASETAGIEAALSVLSRKRIEIRNGGDVRGYLLRHSDMADMAVHVCDLASRCLGPQSQLSLEVYHDPEFEDEYLTLVVRQEVYDERLFDAIQDLRKEYQHELAGASGWFLVTTDFEPPK